MSSRSSDLERMKKFEKNYRTIKSTHIEQISENVSNNFSKTHKENFRKYLKQIKKLEISDKFEIKKYSEHKNKTKKINDVDKLRKNI